ncbi:MAG: hypothetical protein ACK41C_03185 [Phenylobacterium sp.]|uniref:hypothetical protein n=1 Tax=Phenylobacterium sp. TaxID=1871053 RepID=UPI00391D6571
MSTWIRQIHRWLSLAFTAAVLANIAAMTQRDPPLWLGFLALLPLIPLMLTGLYMFVSPYAAKWRGARRVQGEA